VVRRGKATKKFKHKEHEAHEEESRNQDKPDNTAAKSNHPRDGKKSIDRYESLSFFFVRLVLFVFKFLSCLPSDILVLAGPSADANGRPFINLW
jgi:hypothetical protein